MLPLSLRTALLTAFACATVLVACVGEKVPLGGGDDGGGDDGGGGTDVRTADGTGGQPCTSDADCTNGTQCAFAINEACNATGACVALVDLPCNSEPQHLQGCGCDGTEVDWFGGCGTWLPSGYAPAPIANMGACGGGPDAGDQCTSQTDCGPGVCAFLESAGCSAHVGICVAGGDTCQAYEAGCACDGTTFNLICSGLPSGFVTKPFRHTGQCIDGG